MELVDLHQGGDDICSRTFVLLSALYLMRPLAAPIYRMSHAHFVWICHFRPYASHSTLLHLLPSPFLYRVCVHGAN